MLLCQPYRLERQNHEFVAADTRDDVRFAERLSEQIGRFNERQIALAVAERVVDLLEPVQVDKNMRDALPHAVRHLHVLARQRLKAAAIVEARQVVHQGHGAQRHLQLMPLDRVPDRAHQHRAVRPHAGDAFLGARFDRPYRERVVFGARERDDRDVGRVVAEACDGVERCRIVR